MGNEQKCKKRKGYKMSSIIKLIAGNNYVVLNRDLIRILGVNAALLLAELSSEYSYFEKEKMLQPDGSFFSTQENIEQHTTLTRSQQKPALDILISKGILQYVRKGMPAKRYFKIDESRILEVLADSDDLQLAENLQTCLQDSANRKAENLLTSEQKTCQQVSRKSATNINNITVINNSNKNDLPNVINLNAIANCDLSEPMKEALKKWVAYKVENSIDFSERQLSDLITEIKDTSEEFGEQLAIDAVDNAIKIKSPFIFSYKYALAHKQEAK